ncbi:hypothetical protein C2S51_030403 [Perilla frutescens var. frutescens]|nr:hypothetical protein C2S51_030403 [Perilla frutescens var. frutescens]
MDPKAFISDWYHKTKYMVTYEHSMRPIPGKKFMLSCGSIEQLEPPPMIQMSGRPRKKRIRGSHESLKGKTSEKLSRKEVKLRCTICRSADHNRAKCPNKGSEGTCTDKEKNIQTQQLFKARNRRRTTGLGIYINEQTRNMILNELRRAKQASRSYGSRKIIFAGDGSQSITPTNLPFKAPGLKWKGKPSVTASQLHIQREKKRARTGNKDAST